MIRKLLKLYHYGRASCFPKIFIQAVISLPEKGFTKDSNEGLVTCDAMVDAALTQADRTEESGSRRRRVTVESIFAR